MRFALYLSVFSRCSENIAGGVEMRKLTSQIRARVPYNEFSELRALMGEVITCEWSIMLGMKASDWSP